jgi:hypothetical protein
MQHLRRHRNLSTTLVATTFALMAPYGAVSGIKLIAPFNVFKCQTLLTRLSLGVTLGDVQGGLHGCYI